MTIDLLPTWVSQDHASYGSERKRIGSLYSTSVRAVTIRAGMPSSVRPFQSRAVKRMRASMKYSKYFTLFTCPYTSTSENRTCTG